MKNKWRITAFLPLLFLMTGCQASGGGPNVFRRFLVDPLTGLLDFNAGLFNGNYGLSIILMTLAIRLLLLPLMARQYKNQQSMKVKMDALKPEMAEIQAKIKQTKDTAKQQELQKELMMLYQKHGVNPLNMGCLPLLIQMPILMGFYYAISGSHEIATHTFLWFSLGQADYMMAILAGIIYYVQARVSMRQMAADQQGMMKMMSLISPAMILFISFSAPAALPLYWCAGGLFMIMQTAFLQKRYAPARPALKQESIDKS